MMYLNNLKKIGTKKYFYNVLQGIENAGKIKKCIKKWYTYTHFNRTKSTGKNQMLLYNEKNHPSCVLNNSLTKNKRNGNQMHER